MNIHRLVMGETQPNWIIIVLERASTRWKIRAVKGPPGPLPYFAQALERVAPSLHDVAPLDDIGGTLGRQLRRLLLSRLRDCSGDEVGQHPQVGVPGLPRLPGVPELQQLVYLHPGVSGRFRREPLCGGAAVWISARSGS
jgi:hypothetical protein